MIVAFPGYLAYLGRLVLRNCGVSRVSSLKCLRPSVLVCLLFLLVSLVGYVLALRKHTY